VALLAKFFGRTASEGAAFALGLATGPVLYPAVREIEQEANRIYPSAAVDAGTAAAIAAEDVESRDWAAGEALSHGLDGDRFDAMLGEALNAPALPELLSLWRRGLIDTPGFEHGLRKAKMETRWDGALQGLHDVLLTPDVLANGRQQGFVDVDRQHSESALQGVTSDRADILFELSGNPPGPETLQRALNRGVIDRATFDQAIREGRTKTKYTGFYETMAHSILSAATWVTAHLKGHATADEMHAGGAAWGYSPEDMDLWFETEGNPATPHQIHIGYARGAELPGAGDEKAAILKSVQQGRTRPEYFDLIYAGRYSYPSAFVLRSLVQTNAITQQEGEQALLFSGWEPTFAAKVAAAWAGGTTGTATDTHVAKAQTQLWTQTHKSYLAGEVSATVARNKLGQAGVDAASIAAVLGVWDHEKELIRKQLTPAQIKKALTKSARNAATGQTWTRDEAIAALLNLGYDVTTANDYLDIP
jgi:hypothetical protein